MNEFADSILKKQCHREVFGTLKNFSVNTNKFVCIRQPYEKNMQPACKVMIAVDGVEKANDLQKSIEIIVCDYNKMLRETGLYSKFDIPIKYKIQVINATGKIKISASKAEKRKVICGTEINQKFLENFGIKTTFEPQKKYTYALNTGVKYKCTYFDTYLQKRCQISIGNVVIVVNGGCVEFEMSELRKQRSDRKKPIFCIENVTVYE